LPKSEPFPFEKTEIYQKSMEFVRKCRKICCSLPRNYYSDIDQLKRAAMSICQNFAEGFGRWHKKDKKHFYTISKGSAYEARLVFQATGHNGDDTLPGLGNIYQMFTQAYNVNSRVRIHSNSWGDTSYGQYGNTPRNIDRFVWNRPNMSIVIAAGNEGIDDYFATKS